MSKAMVIAHRGASRACPQNTVSSFKKAVEMHADGFENDVHFTKDRHIVVCHNYEINETSTGKGKINDLTLEELRSYDFGSYFDPAFKGEKIPTLDEFLEVSRDGGISVMNIEIKPPQNGDFTIVERTLETVEGFGLTDKLLVSSFSDEVLIRTKLKNANVKTGLLYDPNSEKIDEIFDDPCAFALNIGCDALHPVYLYVDEDYMEDAHKNGLIVNAWTCDTERVINALLDIGIDGIITDVPDLARTLVDAR